MHCDRLEWCGPFFVLSGFLIGGILMDAKGSPNYFRKFYARRFYRIIPLYYAWIIGYFLILAASRLGETQHFSAPREPNIWMILTHCLFIQNLGFVHHSGISIAWFASTWPLAVEEQFYLIAPLVFRAFSRRVLPCGRPVNIQPL
jgi:peptidoglycan/LPS O-acetylase OafA/YrhL